MAKLINFVPGSIRVLRKEELEDMDISLPTQLERYLDKTIGIIKKYNLPRKKEQFVIAKLIDGLDMNPAELQQAVSKLKRYKIVHK